MPRPTYLWRQLSDDQRTELLAWRKDCKYPWHSPPHQPNFGHRRFLVSAACYEHNHYIGHTPHRMDAFSGALLETATTDGTEIYAWCVLPNHYHLLVNAPDILRLLHNLGRLHGRTSHQWNGEDNTRGRKVFFRAVERSMRSDRHFWATLNYVHHNPVHHGCVKMWTDWPWSSARQYLTHTDRVEAERIWREYPIRDYGKGWDDASV